MVKGTRAKWGTCSRTVLLGSHIPAISYWDNIIAVGSVDGDIIILGAISGSQIAVLSGHTMEVKCLTFSSDGKSLVSGSNDNTVKLWDVQTGGVIKTFYGHTDWVLSVSISADQTRISSGSHDETIHLWDIHTGEPLCVIKQEQSVPYVKFSPKNPQHIIFESRGKTWQWDVNGHQISPAYDDICIAFSPDHTLFALCNKNIVTVQNSDSKAIVAKFHVANGYATQCCFSPDGRLVAAADYSGTVYVWDIASPGPHPIETFVGHTGLITSLIFPSPSSLISVSEDKSIKFWQISILSTDPVATDLGSTPLTPPIIRSVSLQTRAGIAISSDADGKIKTWDTSTGLCKATFQIQIPAIKGMTCGLGDAKIIDGRLIFVWCMNRKIYICDTEKGELLQTLDPSDLSISSQCWGLRISGDGSKVFCLFDRTIKAWSMWSWEVVGEVEVGLEGELYLDSLCIYSSRVRIHSKDSLAQEGWDFGTSGSSPIPFDPSTERPHLEFIGGTSWQTDGPSWIKNTVTGKGVFQLSGEYAKPIDVQWDGQYLVAGYEFGEVLVLDFHHVLSRLLPTSLIA